MDFLKQLRDTDLFNLARNPAAFCRADALKLLVARGSVLSKHPDVFTPEPDKRPKRPRDIPATFDRTIKPEHTNEVFKVLERVPQTHLIDMAAAVSVYPKEIRLYAAKLVHAKIPTSNEFARKVRVKRENDRDFAAIMLEATPELVPK